MTVTEHNSIILYGYALDDSGYRIQRFDPDAANDEDLGPMYERLFASYVGIGDNVYIIGGRLGDEQGNETKQVDKFNIRTRRVIPATPLAYRRCRTACCTVEVSLSGDRTQRVNGIIICGGQNSEGESVKIVELFIPEENRMHRLPAMRASRLDGAAVALPDGRVFVAGGCNSRYPYREGAQASVEFCRLQSDWQATDGSDFWQPVAPMTQASSGLAMAYVKGRVIAAGCGPEGRGVEVFSPPDADHLLGQWTLATPMSTLNSCSALLVCNNRLFAVGGFLAREVEEVDVNGEHSSWQWTVKRAATYVGSFYGATSALL